MTVKHVVQALLLAHATSLADAGVAGAGLLGRAMPPNGGHLRKLAEDQCNARALNLLPPPSFQAHRACFAEKNQANSTHNWSVPGADLSALRECWCANNMTETMQEYHCCDHRDIYPMCTLDCDVDCSSQLAQDCLSECPSMCLEMGEYTVDSALCQACDWTRCWPVLKCLTDEAAEATEEGTVNLTCHETRFRADPRAQLYQDCWKSAPKHSSHWNVLSAVRHCACREEMPALAEETDCCGSKSYDGGVCSVSCKSEAECMTQEAQGCIQQCQNKCPVQTASPSLQCLNDCIGKNSRCWQYMSCRPPQTSGYICDNGEYPEASSGCCYTNTSEGRSQVGCPRLCVGQRIWRVDTSRGIPTWARYTATPVYQCTCDGCPSSPSEGIDVLSSEISGDIWTNGQMMLVDIARNEGLKLGPNKQMQAIVIQRNAALQAVLDSNSQDATYLNSEVDRINREYAALITQAARTYPDDGAWDGAEGGRQRDGEKKGTIMLLIIVIVGLLGFLICALTAAVVYRRMSRKQAANIEGTGSVVIGNPVHGDPAAQGEAEGAATAEGAAVMRNGAPTAKGDGSKAAI